ncbi:AraC family transcriptional regulator [Mucilaginibacter pallidiroseus]|uniref:AraC family transcriptional regulator n=1 Tax=Mucilaginibacter pallidiroseus TaxID=2599295 RepID=A0A563U0J1_9SPHI|nr:helix-turn-helix domain-containing protein [Mucilaginibacter pallidiroseus]TWR25147.1 AraC family transcriptional regulator [Mucilaginibacter pallidiroseus]
MKHHHIKSISNLHEFFRYAKPLHPLISIVDMGKVDRSRRERDVAYRLDLYAITLKKVDGTFKYGRTDIDFTEGTLLFTAPDQVITSDPSNKVEGWGLFIHPDFFNVTTKGYELTTYSFFGYNFNEGLHVSDAEKVIIENLLQNIEKEIASNLDNHSHHLILTNLELMLSYAARFYDRQFITRAKPANDLVIEFELLLNEYFKQESLINSGLPHVKYFAERLNKSPNYLSDLLVKYTGMSTQMHIHGKLIDKAKHLLWGTNQAINEIAFNLGFEHPSHFTKLFKNKTGQSPKEYRMLN